MLGCLPLAATGLLERREKADDLPGALARSYRRTRSFSGTLTDVEQALDVARKSCGLAAQRRALRGLPGWERDGGIVRHLGGRHFEVMGVAVTGHGREVDSWSQPMIRAIDVGFAALLVTRIEGVLHALVSLGSEIGYRNRVEVGPTVASRGRWADLGADVWPAHLATVLSAYPEGVHYDVVQSEEGGRLFRTRTRHLIVEGPYVEPGPEHRWLTLGQLEALVARGHAVGIEARSLLACLQTLLTRDSDAAAARGTVPTVGLGVKRMHLGQVGWLTHRHEDAPCRKSG